jgi:hypothetical protein
MLATALQRLLAVAIAVSIFIAALAFSVVLFAVVAAVGVLALGYAWWRQKFGRPRRVDAPMRGRPGRDVPPRGRGEIIDLPSREVGRGD